MSKSKVKSVLIVLEITFALLFIVNYEINLDTLNNDEFPNNNKELSTKSADSWVLTQPIIIDDSFTGYWDWATTAASNDWCSGSGTWADPYLIENVTISVPSTSAHLTIVRSDVYFKIRNCTFLNAAYSSSAFGIQLYEANNGLIINNTCSNNGVGITLYNSNNNTIQENTLNNNYALGIYLGIHVNYGYMDGNHNNTILGNTMKNNGMGGIALHNSRDNTIQDNTAINNVEFGIGLGMSSNNNTIYNNNVDTHEMGIGIDGCNNNKIIKNTAINSLDAGIALNNSNFNNISENDAILNDMVGIGLQLSDNNTISQNRITDNTMVGLAIDDSSDNNTIFCNELIDNSINAMDNGTNNKWDNGSLGNYWSDYMGYDNDKNGIGDTPYDIPGTAGSQDNFPIWKGFLRLNMPENKSYIGPMDGYYPGTYGFENDKNGVFPKDWLESGSGSYEGNAYIVDSKDNHNKVMYINDSGSSMRLNPIQQFGVVQTSGTVEMWLYYNSHSSNTFITLSTTVYIYSEDNIWYYYNGTKQVNTTLSSINQWFRVSIDFSGDGTYKGLSPNTYNFSIYTANGSLYYSSPEANYYLLVNPDYLSFITAPAESTEIWIDAVGYSWDDGYQIGDNEKEGLLLDIEENIGLNWSAYSFDGQANNTILGDSVIPLPDYGSHSIQVFANDSLGVNYKSELRYFRVNFTRIPIVIDELVMGKTWADAVIKFEYCRGSGTFNDPYIIEWVVIDAGGTSSGISVLNSVDKYFIIKNCMIYNTGGYPDGGIFLFTTDKGKIVNNYLYNCYSGIFLIDSRNNTISRNIISENLAGVALLWSENNTISSNDILSNTEYGIVLTDNSNNNTVSDNDVFYNGLYGINLISGMNNTIRGNNVSLNLAMGIALQAGAYGTELYDNEIRENVYYGIWIWGGQSSTLYNNYFYDNTLQNAIDDGVNNKWDNGVIGNFWNNYTGKDKNDDGIGDTAWDIPGSAGSQDRYPIWDDGPEPTPPPPPSDGDDDDDDDEEAAEAIHGYNVFILIGLIFILLIFMAKKRKKINAKF